MLNIEDKAILHNLLDAEPNVLTKNERIAISKVLYTSPNYIRQIHWKEDMILECPHCGHVDETTAYLNITECNNECDVCGEKYDVELWASSFEQRCTKRY